MSTRSNKISTNNFLDSFFDSDLESSDNEIFNSIQKEFNRQQNHIELIASENIVSKAVL